MSRAITLGLATALLALACSGPQLAGTVLSPTPAPEFTLTDVIGGESLSLSSLRGNAVALAFLYTHCPDSCPLTAERFREGQRLLASDAERVVFVAVSVDPAGDTPESVRAFTDDHRLRDRWHYLIGPRGPLTAVWAAYGIGAFADPSGKPFVSHNDAVYLIDPQGRERAVLHASNSAEELATSLRALLR